MQRVLLVLFSLSSFILFGKVHPEEGAVLTYRVIKFEYLTGKWVKGAVIEIARGRHDNDINFATSRIGSPFLENKFITEVPDFGSEYTWRVKIPGKPVAEYYHFTVATNLVVDTSNYRLRVTGVTNKNAGSYVFVDKTSTLYDMSGHAVWFLPQVDGIDISKSESRDMKLSPKGTITFIRNEHIYEIDWDGKILWEGPDTMHNGGEKNAHYHHEFTRLKNGHYMVLGYENKKLAIRPDTSESLDIPGLKGFGPPKKRQQFSNQRPYISNPFGTVIEYDEQGRMVWQWKHWPYYALTYLGDTLSPAVPGHLDPHENSFAFDEGKKVLFVSFKNANQVYKIDYPSGRVLAIYGDQFNTGHEFGDNGLFCEQHSVNISDSGQIYVFNNNMNHTSNPFNIVLMQEDKDNKLQLTWKTEVPVDMNALKNQLRPVVTSGGNVTELPDHSFFISAALPFADLFVIDRNKQVLWSGVIEQWDNYGKSWQPMPTYRASIIVEKKNLINLINNSR